MNSMKSIVFSTGNERKILEARAACDAFNIEVVPMSLQFDEIQSHDPLLISRRKASDAFALANVPAIVVADTSWSIPALNGFPGGYMKDVAEWFTPNDFIDLMASKQDKTLIFRETIVYKSATEEKVFSKEYHGTIADSPRGNSGNAMDKVALFNGRTFSEAQALGETSHDPKEFVWYEFAEWYANKP